MIDTDKDKKYHFRKNENGEDELFIDDGLTEEIISGEELGFEVPEYTEDDEEAAVMTPEQLEARRLQKEKELEEKRQRVERLLASAREDESRQNYATALEDLVAAEEIDPENGDVHALKLVVYTRGFTDYSDSEKAAEVAEDVKEFTSDESKDAMYAVAKEGLEREIDAQTRRVEVLKEENESKKAERAVKFNAGLKKSWIIFACAAVPFAVALALAIYFSTVMFATQDGANVVLTIVFAALAFVFLIVLAFAARGLNTAARRVRLNKKNTSTKLGREYIAENKRLEELNAVYGALKTE